VKKLYIRLAVCQLISLFFTGCTFTNNSLVSIHRTVSNTQSNGLGDNNLDDQAQAADKAVDDVLSGNEVKPTTEVKEDE